VAVTNHVDKPLATSWPRHDRLHHASPAPLASAPTPCAAAAAVPFAAAAAAAVPFAAAASFAVASAASFAVAPAAAAVPFAAAASFAVTASFPCASYVRERRRLNHLCPARWGNVQLQFQTEHDGDNELRRDSLVKHLVLREHRRRDGRHGGPRA
jgi:hypothetical protein